ncbi:Crooked neck-like protein 1 [Halotydeus destructor]|nr:Crooked neck-like protein 1 [Halotydeus destructor]
MASGLPRGKAAKTKVKNKTPAEIQITAEQLLREAKERDLEIVQAPPKQKISDPEELADYQLRKRKAFEDNIRKNRSLVGNWLKYAGWEESQNEIERARSIFERALDVDHKVVTVWVKYAEMEQKARQVNHARNVFDRAVSLLPRCNQLWYKYTYMEEILGNVANCRQVFERWMEWEPEEQPWMTYINFEMRYTEVERARVVYTRFVSVHPDVKNWIKFARFEEKNGFLNKARETYERAIEFFGDDYLDEKLFIAFAKFEENQRENERVKVIYKYAIDKLRKDEAHNVYREYALYEKKHGNREGIEAVVMNKRRFLYEEKLKENSFDYDTWFDFVRLMEEEGDVEATRKVYERAIANIPPQKEKRYWRRYIYLWIYYAVYEELQTEDFSRAREVYHFALKVIPHKSFTFAKFWILAAKFEIRQKDVTAARKLLGMAIGMSPKDKLFREYIELEIQLREFDRCRTLYQKFLEFSPENCTSWIKFAELETILGEHDRAEAIYELAVEQPRLDMPEVVWKAYIDYQIEQEEFEKARMLYERLLDRTQHVKVWISFARFELQADPGSEEGANAARSVFTRAHKASKEWEEKEARMLLLEAWLEFEQEHGTEETRKKVESQTPKKVKKRRKRFAEDGTDAGWEEYFDYIFPTDAAAQPHLKFLEKAKKWKQSAPATDASTSSS